MYIFVLGVVTEKQNFKAEFFFFLIGSGVSGIISLI